MNNENNTEIHRYFDEAICLVDEMQRLTDEYLGHLPDVITLEENSTLGELYEKAIQSATNINKLLDEYFEELEKDIKAENE
jgi:hypothetical protein